MRSVEDKGCLNHGQQPQESSSSSNSGVSFEFQKANGVNRTPHHRTGLGKPTPSKWDDAQKWLVNLSRGGDKNQSKTTPRNSNADDRRLIAPVPVKEGYSSGEEIERGSDYPSSSTIQYEPETKNVDCEESIWKINKPSSNSAAVVRSICVRDMGTEMTPIASQEPSRAATPIRAGTPVARSPISSGTSTPVSHQNGAQMSESAQTFNTAIDDRVEASRGNAVIRLFPRDADELNTNNVISSNTAEQPKNANPLESRATAWDEAERAKYMARFKREEVKIQAWENHEKRKAEMEMRKKEVKAERLKTRAQEKYNNKLASTRRIAEERRANAEAKLNEKAVRTSERADYIRRTGRLPSSFSIKLPSCCCSCPDNLSH